MNKKIIAIAIATAMAAPVAMADVKLSGKTVFALSQATGTDITGAAANFQAQDTGSKIAIDASAKAGSGATVFAHLENHVNLADSGSGESGFLGKQRFAFMGYKAGFGSFTMGSMKSPMKGATGSHDLFADTAGDHNGVKANGLGFTHGAIQPIQEGSYTEGDSLAVSTKAGGFKIMVSHNLPSDALNSGDTQASISGKAGPVAVTAAMYSGAKNETYKSMTYLAGKMKFGNIGATLQYQARTTQASVASTTTGLGATMKAGNGKAKLQYLMLDNVGTDSDVTFTTVGYDMGLGKGVGVGINYTMMTPAKGDGVSILGAGLAMSF